MYFIIYTTILSRYSLYIYLYESFGCAIVTCADVVSSPLPHLLGFFNFSHS